MARVLWAVWWFGTTLIVLSWIGLVANLVGWGGFGLACASVIATVVRNRYWRLPPHEGGDDPKD